MPTEPYIEPWMRGSIMGVHPLLAPVLYSFEQSREDLAKWTEGLTTEQLWAKPHDTGAIGFHIRHLAGATDRLMTYLQGQQLSAEQLSSLKTEHEPGADRATLLAHLDSMFKKAEAIVRALDPATLTEPRVIGRKQLPTTVIGLLTHIAEHTQRHVGEAIMTVKWVKAD